MSHFFEDRSNLLQNQRHDHHGMHMLKTRRVLWVVLAAATLLASGCTRKKPPPPAEEVEATPPTPKVDESFLDSAFGAGRVLANKPLIADIDHRPGVEALIAMHRGRRDYQVAVVRGNREVLSQTPLGGKILAHANIAAVGEFRAMDLWGDGKKTYLMPVETMVYRQTVCGFIAFRYRMDSLSVIAEFSTKCWRKASGGNGKDPFLTFAFERSGEELRVITQEQEGKRLYRWDAKQQAFLSQAPMRSPAAPPKRKRRRRGKRRR
jgi:hypothetical protein